LRKAAIAEREAALFYLAAANMLGGDLRTLFLTVAEDEMRHFVMTMHHIAVRDSAQAKALGTAGLDVFIMPRMAVPKWAGAWPPTCAPLPKRPPDSADNLPAEDMQAVDLLTKAITNELVAINLYECFCKLADSGSAREHFDRLQTNDKSHVAQFIAALYELTCEPPPLQEHDGNIM
jgi:rubrerythrin